MAVTENVMLRMFCYTVQIKRKLCFRLRPHKKAVY